VLDRLAGTVLYTILLARVPFPFERKLLISTVMVTSSSVWFQGPVADAVSQVNAKGCVFAVFARGKGFCFSICL
jgi:hypothetical protein